MTSASRLAAVTRPPFKRPATLIAVGLFFVIVGICGLLWTVVLPHRSAIEFRVPGETTLTVDGPARMTLWNQNAPPPDFRADEVTVLIQDVKTGREVEWQTRTDFSIGGSSGRGGQLAAQDSRGAFRQTLADFRLPEAGTYLVRIGGAITPRMFAATRDRGPWYVGPIVLFPGGLIMFIGVVWLAVILKSRRAS